MRLQSYKSLPSIVRGYPLVTRGHWFSIILPIARTNLVTNPSFETATTGWAESSGGGSVARTTDKQFHGAYSLEVTANASAGGYFSISLTSGTIYAGSIRFKGLIPGATYKVGFFTTGNVALSTYQFKATGRWQWVYAIWVETSTTTRRFGVYRVSTGTGHETFWLDGAQVEVCAAGQVYPTTYIDGDQQGLVPNQSPPAYLWNGTPHASTSSRSGQTRAGGRLVRLDLYGLLLMAIVGLGLPTPNNIALPYAQLDGAQYERTQKPMRTFTITNRVQAKTGAQLDRLRSDLSQVVDRDYVGQQQPLVLRYQRVNDCGTAESDEADIVCSYAGGLEGQQDNHHGEDVSMVFQQYIPLVIATGSSGVSLTVQQNVGVADHIIQRTAGGTWQLLSTGLTGGSGIIYALVYGKDGTLYAGGDFTNAGSSGADYIAKWDGSSWAVVRSATALNAPVNALAVGPDGKIYAGGQFTNADGVAAADYIAVYDPVANTWAAVGSGANNNVLALAFNGSGTLYAGGQFTDIGGSGADYIAQWNGSTWAVLGSATALNDYVDALAIGIDGSTLYVGGNFVNANGIAAADYIAKWTTTWAALSTGMNNTVYTLTVGSNGILYAGGIFTTAGGVAVNLIAQWNGNSWTPLGTGLTGGSSIVYKIAAGPNGLLHVGGSFNTAGGISLTDAFAAWNGSTWLRPDVDFAGFPSIRGLAFAADGAVTVSLDGQSTPTPAAAITTVTNDGSAKVYPTLVIKGPTTGTSLIYQIINYTTGRAIYLNYTINAGETAILVFQPDNLSFTSDFQGNIASKILPGSNTADFFLQPGANSISFFAASSSVTAVLQWQDCYNNLVDLTL